jgi:hypothetical protein
VFKDPAFVAEADKQKLEVDHISAEEITGLTERVMATPPEVVARIQALLPGGGGQYMELRNLGETGLRVSAVGLGCNNFGRNVDRDTARVVVHKALDMGVTLFDTGDTYGHRGGSETIMGEVLARAARTSCSRPSSAGRWTPRASCRRLAPLHHVRRGGEPEAAQDRLDRSLSVAQA